MALSILHRVTGSALGFGTLLLAWWLMAIAAGPDQYSQFQDFIAHPVGRLVLLGFSYALIFHLLNGIRHLYWDLGLGLDVGAVQRSGKGAVALSVILTILVWVGGYYAAGRIG
jgi:succinate dehydrogenase / fumarate reductase cytochrome b subunit